MMVAESTWARKKGIKIIYHSGKCNANADTLSRGPQSEALQETSNSEVQVAAVMDTDANTITDLLQADATVIPTESLQNNQWKDPDLLELIQYLQKGTLPTSQQQARKLVLQTQLFAILDGILYYVDRKHANRRLLVLPKQMWERLIVENHRGKYGGHFSVDRVFKSLVSL